jgi:hypothetical protein
VNIVSKLTRRTLSRQVGTPFTTGGGNSALAFDNDLTTSCVQVSVNGTLGCIFSSPQQITSVGVLFADAETLSYFVEYSLDGVTNWTALDAMTGSIAAGQWVWGDLNGSPAALGWRIRAVGTAPMSITELYFGTTPTEIPLDPWNLDEYNAMPNKTTPGPVLNWYQQRDLDSTYLLVWPVPATANAYDQLVVWVQEYLDTVSAPTQSLDVPRRWYDAITAMLARRLCRSLPEADLKRYDMLRAEEQEAVELAEGEERDPSNTNYDMGMGAYTA